MADYPTSIDVFVNPVTGEVVDSSRIGHSFDAIEAIETFLGVSGAPAGAGTLVGRIKTLETAGSGTPSYYVPPSAHSLKGWTSDPAQAYTGSAVTATLLYMSAIWMPQADTVTSLKVINVNNGGGTITARGGLYNAAGNLLVTSGAHTSGWNSNGPNSIPLASTAVPAGLIWGALIIDTALTFATVYSPGSGSGYPNAYISSNGLWRFGQSVGGYASLPATRPTLVTSANGLWMGVA